MNARNYITNMDDLRIHVIREYPREAGGYVGADNVFVSVPNISETPEDAYEMEMGALIGLDVKCIVHSHPYEGAPLDDPRIPSEQDMQCQIDTDVEWAIVSTDGKSMSEPVFWGDYSHRPPLMQREFIHCVQDCYTFVTDWLHSKLSITLPPVVRRPDTEDYSAIEQQLRQSGFAETTLPEETGDVLLMKMGSPNYSHIAVVVEPNLVAHHVNGKFPRQQPTVVFAKYTTKRMRHRTNPGSTTKGEHHENPSHG